MKQGYFILREDLFITLAWSCFREGMKTFNITFLQALDSSFTAEALYQQAVL